MTHQKNIHRINICPLANSHIDAVAKLHEKEINYGFGSYLGKNFLRYLYKTIIGCKNGLGLVAVNDQEEVLGFITGTMNLKRFYKRFIRKYSVIAGFLVLPKLLRWKAIKSFYQDLLYPSEGTQYDLPEAEIISTAVSPNARGLGIGRLLTEAAFEEFRKRGISKIKVLVGDRLQANKFYRRMNFEFITHITYNSDKMDANVYVKDLVQNAKGH